HPALDRRSLRSLIDGLFATDFHDLRSTGIAILERERELLRGTDLPWLIELVRRSANWAHVDWLSTKVVGFVISAVRPGARSKILRSWARSPDLWTRRAALLAQLDELRAGRGDFALFAALAAPMLGEREFFIRKAIGWVLRDVSRKRPELAFDFLLRHRGQVSGLTFREGSRGLPAGLRAELESPVRSG
ncbi:MAG TPA: DNA alkylation repair protein, partial [Thermoanaerobaculia bacterium]